MLKSGETAPAQKSEENSLIPDHENVSLTYTVGKSDISNGLHGPNSNSSKSFGERDLGRHDFSEPKVIHEAPSEDEIVTATCLVESEIEEDAGERIRHSISDHALQSGRKTRIESSPSDNYVDSMPEKTQNNKKRRQQENSNPDLLDDAIDYRLISTHANGSEEWVHRNATEGAGGDTEELIMDKFIKIVEVTCEMTEEPNTAAEEKPECIQKSVPISNQNVAEDGGTNGHMPIQ